ncbi:COX15/CtaA family protein [Leptospira sp. GIMC2001]|uniref:COX15/CtaA family protein n=1 Tax=Leptospira sp. GIMC2001 TaxID=1513297 RepID=UPI002349B8B7|nr:COX15/CtaA family protein [Leptospira sp. GIMC2001]WCL48501.1 COX15/CtaA family protein [Leptospira sp. GIMC2001]
MKNFSRLFFLISILIYLNIYFGPLVRATDSGLACPDWPLCHGKFIPEYSFQIAMEVGHRFYSGTIGIIIAIGFIWGFLASNLKPFRGLLLLQMFFLGTQVMLGALTVTKLLDPTTVNLHLLNAVLLLTISITITLLSNWKAKSIVYEKWSFATLWNSGNKFLTIAVLITGFQLFMGGRVSSHYAGLACPDFPTCYGDWFPEMIGTIRYQMEHRILGYIVALSIFTALWIGIRNQFEGRSKILLQSAAGLIILQIVLGAFNVLYHLPKLLTATHTGIGVLTFIVLYLALVYRNLLPKNQGELL